MRSPCLVEDLLGVLDLLRRADVELVELETSPPARRSPCRLLSPAERLELLLVEHRAQLVDHRAELVGDRLVARFLDLACAPCRTPSSRRPTCSARRLNRCASMTMPSTPDGTSRLSFLTSSPARPKIACSSFSSGVSSLFDLGETLPTRMSPGTTKVPMRTMPLSSRLPSALGETFGMSRVNSSLPSFVSRISISNSSMWIEV